MYKTSTSDCFYRPYSSMNTLGERIDTTAITILPPLIMGAGFIALFAGFNFFFALLIWILGFAVLLPIAEESGESIRLPFRERRFESEQRFRQA